LEGHTPAGSTTSEVNRTYPVWRLAAEVRLHQNGFRDYDPATGRYLEADPIRQRAGTNLYAYVRLDPVNRADPFGLYHSDTHGERFQIWAGEEGFSEEDARRLAAANLWMDHPKNLRSYPRYWPWGCAQHFRPRGEVLVDLEEDISSCDIESFGEHMHVLQDTFSHEGRSCWRPDQLGHTWHTLWQTVRGNPDTDEFIEGSDREVEMEAITRQYLRAFKERCRPSCDPISGFLASEPGS
jgi:RHS repeat-associated protein